MQLLPAKKEWQYKNKNTDDNNTNAANNDDVEEVVFVVNGDKVKKYSVKTGIQDINYIEILSGLKAGEQVVTGPYDVVSKQLQDSAKVKVVPKEQLIQNFFKK